MSEPAKLIAAEPQLFVAHVEAACTFYTQKLGFAVRFLYGEPPFYAQVFRGGASLNLRAMDEPVFLPIREKEQLLSASIPVEGIAALYKEFQAAGRFVRARAKNGRLGRADVCRARPRWKSAALRRVKRTTQKKQKVPREREETLAFLWHFLCFLHCPLF